MNPSTYRKRRMFVALVSVIIVVASILISSEMWQPAMPQDQSQTQQSSGVLAHDALQKIAIKGRAPKTNYDRAQFGNGWVVRDGCDTRNIILRRDMKQTVVSEDCKVLSGKLNDPYTGNVILFKRGAGSSGDVQIDHVVALSDAWQKGAQQLTHERREQLANDPLELLAVDGKTNEDKGAGDAATWLPPNKFFRCQYVARQIAVKAKYDLWMTQAEHDAIVNVLTNCPGQKLPSA